MPSVPLPSPSHEPAPSTEHGQAFGVVTGGGHDRFGAIADLAVFREQARELAERFAQSLGVTAEDFREDPFITVNCIGLALCWQEEMLLQQQIQRDLAVRAEALAGDYGLAMYTATKNNVHERHQKAINAAHMRSLRYREELESLVARRRRQAALAAQPAAPASPPSVRSSDPV